MDAEFRENLDQLAIGHLGIPCERWTLTCAKSSGVSASIVIVSRVCSASSGVSLSGGSGLGATVARRRAIFLQERFSEFFKSSDSFSSENSFCRVAEAGAFAE